MRFRTNDKGFITLRFADFPNTEFGLVGDGSRQVTILRAGAETDAEVISEAVYELETAAVFLDRVLDIVRGAEARASVTAGPERKAG
jgi:hypothetical protein